jgi:TolB-like protein
VDVLPLHRPVLVEVEGHHPPEGEPFLLVQADQLAIDTHRGGASGEAEHRGCAGGVAVANDRGDPRGNAPRQLVVVSEDEGRDAVHVSSPEPGNLNGAAARALPSPYGYILPVLSRLNTALSGRYRVERELGEGGMATVYLAEDLKHHRPVAIKVLKPDLAAALGGERFLREIEIAARLQHPHILPVHDSGEADGLLYYVMPFVEGESLAARISREGGLPVDWSVRILREVADALAYAHGRGLVHSDIKPDNILLSGNHALVADFGIARAVRDAAGATALTGTGISLGTPAYMAPEQAAGEAVDHRADIYALGVVAYEMLAGEPPFRGRTAQAVIGAHLSQPAVPITQHRPGLSPGLSALVMRCLQKHPGDRPQSADELTQLLETAVVPSGSTVAVSTSQGLKVSTRKVALLFALCALLLLGAAYGAMIAFGLPSWVFPAAVALMLIGLPIVLTTQRVEQNRTPSSAPHKLFNWKRAITGGVLAFCVLGLVVGGYMTMRALGIGPVGTLVASGRLKEHPKVILADFTDNTGDSTLATAVTDAFRVDLGQSGAVDLVQGAAIKDAFTRMKKEAPRSLSEEQAREVASREGIPAVVTGEINAIGGGYVISARIIDAEGNVLVPLRETASDSSKIIPAVDKLSRKVRERIGESLRDIRETPALEQVTTASLPALRKYTQGRRAIDAGEDRPGSRQLQGSDCARHDVRRRVPGPLHSTGQLRPGPRARRGCPREGIPLPGPAHRAGAAED